MPKIKQDTTVTPARKKHATPSKSTTSPYFLAPSSPFSITKRHREEEPIPRSTPDRVTSVKKELRLTTSPYFADVGTSTRAEAGFETQVEERKRERKRRRLAIRGDTPEYSLSPPSSPCELAEALRRIKPNLVQEQVRDDPWKIVVATTLLNKTSGKVALPVYWELIRRWPTPIALAQAAAPTVTALLRPLGTQSVRTQRLMRFSNAYVMHPPDLPTLASLQHISPTPDGTPRSSDGDRALDEAPKPLMVSSSQSIYTLASSSPPSSRPSPSTPRSLIKSSQTPLEGHLFKPSIRSQSKVYLADQKASPIAHLPFTGPYAIDSFRIYSSGLPGGGAPSRVEEQLERIAQLPRVAREEVERDDFDETPCWYDPEHLGVVGDEDAEWRRVRPDDKELRRYIVWRWAIEGVAYDPVGHTFEPASWLYLNRLIRQ